VTWRFSVCTINSGPLSRAIARVKTFLIFCLNKGHHRWVNWATWFI
jgi:hypothetical protein